MSDNPTKPLSPLRSESSASSSVSASPDALASPSVTALTRAIRGQTEGQQLTHALVMENRKLLLDVLAQGAETQKRVGTARVELAGVADEMRTLGQQMARNSMSNVDLRTAAQQQTQKLAGAVGTLEQVKKRLETGEFPAYVEGPAPPAAVRVVTRLTHFAWPYAVKVWAWAAVAAIFWAKALWALITSWKLLGGP